MAVATTGVSRCAARDRAPSDRRWRQWLGLMQVAAAAEGRTEVDAADLWLAPFVVADEPGQAEALAQWFQAECLRAVPQDAPWLTRAVEAFERQLQLEQSTWAMHARVEQVANSHLHMQVPDPAKIQIVAP